MQCYLPLPRSSHPQLHPHRLPLLVISILLCLCSDEFRRESGGSRSDVNHIEWLLRRGHKQLTLFGQRNVKQITFKQPHSPAAVS